MTSTGIFRKVDDLGRIVIPKDMRQTLKIKEGDELEVCIGDNKEIVFRKPSLLDDKLELIINICNSVFGDQGYILYDRDGKVITPKDERDLDLDDLSEYVCDFNAGDTTAGYIYAIDEQLDTVITIIEGLLAEG